MGTAIEWTPAARAVLAAADELFYAQGIHAVGVDAIASRAGVTKKTLYDRFGSKDRLVAEYLRQRDARWREFLDERLGAAGDGARARLAAVFDAAADWARTHLGRGCSMVNAHAEIPPGHPAHEVITGQKRRMLDLFTDIARAAGVRDPDDVARGLLLLHEGALVTAGIGVVDGAYTTARDLALDLLDRTSRD